MTAPQADNERLTLDDVLDALATVLTVYDVAHREAEFQLQDRLLTCTDEILAWVIARYGAELPPDVQAALDERNALLTHLAVLHAQRPHEEEG